MSFWGRLRAQAAAAPRRREITLTGGAAVLVLAAGIAVATSDASPVHGSTGTAGAVRTGTGKTTANISKKAPPQVRPLTVESVTPGAGTTGVNGTDPVKVTFNQDVTSLSAMPQLSPSIPGGWSVSGQTATFTPVTGFPVNTAVTVTVPAGIKAGTAKHPLEITQASTSHFTTGSYSQLRLQELLSELGYLPFTFHPSDPAGDVAAANAKDQLSAAYDAPAGTFSWNGSYPSQLTSQWHAGKSNELVTGAIDNIEGNQGWNQDGTAGPEVWSYLLSAVARGGKDPHAYSYVLVTQGPSDENLQLYNDGKVVISTPVNTGTAAAGGTYDGTYPVYERLTSQVMTGQNPDGSTYSDQVYWVNYFHGGEAIHWFQRGSYGWYQSDGCVEVPTTIAESIYDDLNYGALVTVQGAQA
jgi:hypothetical protein